MRFHYDEQAYSNRGAIVFADRFGALRAIRPVGVFQGVEQWETRCRCGAKVVVDAADLLKGRKLSCGCAAELEMKELRAQFGWWYKRPRKPRARE